MTPMEPTTLLPFAFINSVWGWAVILFLGLLLFGSRLPSVARNMGKGINEFKKGLNEGLSDGDNRDGGGGSGGGNGAGSNSSNRGGRSGIDDTSV